MPEKSSKDAVTHRMRIRHLIQKHRGSVSESDKHVAERAADRVGAIDNKLPATSHAGSVPIRQE